MHLLPEKLRLETEDRKMEGLRQPAAVSVASEPKHNITNSSHSILVSDARRKVFAVFAVFRVFFLLAQFTQKTVSIRQN